MRRWLLTLLAVCCTGLSLFAHTPKYEMRAVWLTTNWGLDWPSRPVNSIADVAIQQKELTDILDELQRLGINTLFFQARVRGEVFYASVYEPWASVLSRGKNPGYDPLAFVITECHRRAMECHAWIVTFPVGSDKQVRRRGDRSIVARHRSWCKRQSGEWYLDPGNPEVEGYLKNIVHELVSKYDIDGLHLDYIRYPDNARRFPDSDSFRRWGGSSISLAQWREANISRIVATVYDEVKRLKPWVKVSSAPLGRYASLPGFPASWSCKEAAYQDPQSWLLNGKHDFIAPMMYYKECDYYPFVYDWAARCPELSVVSGLGVYRLEPKEGNWQWQEVKRQVEETRKIGVGQSYFRYENLYRHTALSQWLSCEFYQTPALTPPVRNRVMRSVDTPCDLQVVTHYGESWLSWLPVNGATTYIIYAADEMIDIHRGDHIVAILSKDVHSIVLPTECSFYAVTARDRYGNESPPALWQAQEVDLEKYRINI